jgi:lipopolysaccharide export system protein LptA
MSMTRTLTIAAAALALLALPTMGGAQTTPQTAPRLGQGAVSYGADAGEATPNSLSLRGRAEVVQGQNRLRADVISGSGVNSEIDRIEASGNVYFVTPEQTIRGDRAVFTLSDNEVVMTGDVIVTQGQNVMTGGRLTYNTATQAVTMAGGSGSNGGRIRGVFYPERSGN